MIASSFAPIHERNNLNLGQLLGDHAQLERLQAGEEIPLEEFTARHDPVPRVMIESGGVFPSAAKYAAGLIGVSRAAVYKSIKAGRLRARKIGNVTVVDKASAIKLREHRGQGDAYEKVKDSSTISGGTQMSQTLTQVAKPG